MLEAGDLLLFHKTHGSREVMMITSVQRSTHAMTKQTDWWVVANSMDGRIGHKATMSQIEYMITTGEVQTIEGKYLHIVELLFR